MSSPNQIEREKNKKIAVLIIETTERVIKNLKKLEESE